MNRYLFAVDFFDFDTFCEYYHVYAPDYESARQILKDNILHSVQDRVADITFISIDRGGF